jgi:chromate transporter
MLAVPLVLVLGLAVVYSRFAGDPQVAGALRGMAAVSAGLIGAAGLKLAVTLKRHPLPVSWCAAIAALGFVLVALFKCPLIYVLAGLGGLGCVLTWRRLSA